MTHPTPATHTVHVEMDVEVPDGTYISSKPSVHVDLSLAVWAHERGWHISSYHGGVTAITPNSDG